MMKNVILLLISLASTCLIGQVKTIQTILAEDKIIRSASDRAIDTQIFNDAMAVALSVSSPKKIYINHCWLLGGIGGLRLTIEFEEGRVIGGVSDLLKPNGGETSIPIYGVVFFHPGEVEDPDSLNPWSKVDFSSKFLIKVINKSTCTIFVSNRKLQGEIVEFNKNKWFVLKDEDRALLGVSRITGIPLILDEQGRFQIQNKPKLFDIHVLNAIYRIIMAHDNYLDEARNCFP